MELVVKNLSANARDMRGSGQPPGQVEPLEKAMATGTEEPGGR